jgi:hypothetical protein
MAQRTQGSQGRMPDLVSPELLRWDKGRLAGERGHPARSHAQRGKTGRARRPRSGNTFGAVPERNKFGGNLPDLSFDTGEAQPPPARTGWEIGDLGR